MSDLVSRLLVEIEKTEAVSSSIHRIECRAMDDTYMQAEAQTCDCDYPSSVLRRCEAEKKLIAAYQGVDEALEAADEHNKENPVAIGLHAGLEAGVLAVAAGYGITEEEK